MPRILHKISIQAQPNAVYQALSEIDGLAQWWTETTSGQSAVGERIAFQFGQHTTGMQVEQLEPDSRVAWECVDSTADWVGTRVSFELDEDQNRTMLRFTHEDWREDSDFFAHCSMKWATFLLSLKSFVETGQGRPYPNDVPI